PAALGQTASRSAGGVDRVYGYPIPSGNGQVRALPWIGRINRIAVRFDRDVRAMVDPADLSLRGAASVRPYPIAGFSYDPATYTAVWTLPSPVVNDRLRLVISDDAAAGVAGLDGEWVNPDPRAVPPVRGNGYPSGDGVAGGVFSFLINVLSGDATGDGQVNALDLSDVKRRLNRRAGDGVVGTGAYAALGDVNGDGMINALDVSGVKQRLNRRLPSPGPESLFLTRSAALSDSD